jgi:hypothetical protein
MHFSCLLPDQGIISIPQPCLVVCWAGRLQELTSSALAEFDPYKWQRQHIELPEITLAGPVELVFSRKTDLSLFLPHSTDVPAGRRLLLGPGAALTLRQLKGISLRKPLELPQLPKSYLAEVYAHMKIGEPEPGFENAPGMLFLAGANSRVWCLMRFDSCATYAYLAPSHACLFCDAC